MKDHVKGGALTEVTLYILLALYKPNHGYGIMQFVEVETEGRLTLGAGTLYGALNTLVNKGWIALYGEESTKKKKNYLITDLGKEKVEVELNRLKEVLEKGQSIVNGESR
ncbi:MAG: PadR family transcriptional regulator [Cellulosilyticum sp.]|nr:PadR family transcriptional regulator [Cellulosilyticum sp.]